MPTVEQENEVARERELQRIRSVRGAFLEVFGTREKPTPQGAVIFKHLEEFASYSKPIRELDAHGATDIPRHFAKEGRREMLQAIYNIIEWKEDAHVDTRKPSP